ncbi:MAG: hypothetical protein FWD17_03360, partial [Polyangiaceae bacterium]|nr:hypothetical protein [Polyangiaceae bacterium]
MVDPRMVAEPNEPLKEPCDDRSTPSRLEAAPAAHVLDAWRSWLSALATDAEAAMAAAMAYESLPPDGRDAWLDALAFDCEVVDVPALALYAPLLAVESDGARRQRIETAIEKGVELTPHAALAAYALHGVGTDGVHACVVVAPLYLEFVQVLTCRYSPASGFA